MRNPKYKIMKRIIITESQTKKLIDELFDTSYTYNIYVNSDRTFKSPFTHIETREIRYGFKTKDDVIYDILFIIDAKGTAEMHFATHGPGVGDAIGLINKYDSIKVFNTLKSIIDKHKKDIKKLEFRAPPERNKFYAKILDYMKIKYKIHPSGNLMIANLK
jgi:hypothetical protein